MTCRASAADNSRRATAKPSAALDSRYAANAAAPISDSRIHNPPKGARGLAAVMATETGDSCLDEPARITSTGKTIVNAALQVVVLGDELSQERASCL